MRTLRAILVFAGLFSAQSQPPSPTPLKDTQGKQKDGSPKQGRVDAKDGQSQRDAVVINQYYSQPENGDKHEGKAEQDKSASSEWINTASTVLLAVSTFLLFVATIALCVVAGLQLRTMNAHKQSLESMAEHMESGLAETAKAANAAKVSAESAEATAISLVNSERAWVLVTDIIQVQAFSIAVFSHFAFDLVNRGRTVARLVDSREGFRVLKRGEQLPTSPSYKGRIPTEGFDKASAYVLAPGDKQGMREISIPDTEQREAEIDDGEIQIYAYGRIMYYDFSEALRELQFGYMYLPNQGWVLMREPNYNKHT